MRLLLDEMISPRVAADLRKHGHDVQAIKRDRPELAGSADRQIVRRMEQEVRAIVTNNVVDFEHIHKVTRATGEHHAGMIFTFDDTMPGNKAAIPQWVEALAALLDAHRDAHALRDRVLHLP